MHRTAIVVLLALLFVTAVFGIYTRHQHRVEYVRFTSEVSERDELNIEWNQLLVEESLWSFPHRVEKDATRSLAMKVPEANDIVLLGELSRELNQEIGQELNQGKIGGDNER